MKLSDNRMSTEEAAKYLGKAKRTLEGWRSNGYAKLPYYKVGHSVWYLQADLDEWIGSNRHTNTTQHKASQLTEV